MQTLTIRTTAQQNGCLLLFTLGLSVFAGAALHSHLADGDPSGRVLGLGIGAGTGAAIVGWCAVLYSRAFTECTPAGIRSHGLGPAWHCDWQDVHQINVQPGRRGPTATVVLMTSDGIVRRLGAPVAGGVMPDRTFESKVRKIRDYWHQAAGQPAWPDSPPPGLEVVAYSRDRPRPAAALVFRGVLLLMAFVAIAAVPVAIAEGGSALLVRLGQGQPGRFTAYALACDPACSWVGSFTPRDGGHARNGLILAPGRSPRLGRDVAAVDLDSSRVVYPAEGGSSWILLAILLAIVIGDLALEAALMTRRRIRRAYPHADQPATGSWRLLATASAVALIITAPGFAVARSPVPASGPSRVTLACADYGRWLFAQPASGRLVSLAVLATAEEQAPMGRLSLALSTLSADANTAVTAGRITQRLVAGVSVSRDMAAVSRVCA